MKSLEELKALRDKMKAATDNRAVAGDDEVVVKVGMATCGIAAGARPVSISQTGCIGLCRLEPIVEVFKNGEKYTYVLMTPEKARRVVAEHVVNGNAVKEFLIAEK